jgi:hypothetical protein
MVFFDRDLPKSFVDTGFAPRRAAMGAAKEVAHCLREVPQRLLLHGLRPRRQPRESRPGLGQLSGLLVIPGSLQPRPPVPLLFDSQIPHVARVPAMLHQAGRLLSRGKQPIPGHTRTLTTTTDNQQEGDAAIAPPAKPRGLHSVKIQMTVANLSDTPVRWR